MANAIYPLAKKQLLLAGIDMAALDVKVALINVSGGGTTYTYNAADEFLDDVSSGAIIALTGNLAGKSFGDDGSFDSDDPTIIGVTGDLVEALLMFVDTGTPSTSRLILYQDTGVTGLPLTPDGSDVQIIVDAGGWFIL